MRITLSRRIGLLAILLPYALALSTAVYAETSKLMAESGNSAQSRQHAATEREQRSGTRDLRQKVNKRTEKEWDKADAVFDNRDKCEQNANVNACWKPDTLRCLDRRTSHVITP